MRRALGVSITLFGLSAASAVFGQADGAAKFRETFVQLDANGDTVLDRDEIPESGRAAFDRLLKRGDSNKNGKLELEELRALGQKVAALNDPEIAANRFKNMDKDKDGKITKEEWTGVPANFVRIDADKDGTISKEELTKFMGTQFANQPGAPAKAKKPAEAAAKAKTKKDEGEKPKNEPKKDEQSPVKPKTDESKIEATRRFQLLDKDGDGKISKAEFTREKLFERLDADKDGFLSAAELAKFAKPEE